ncbi:MAG: hypothetical protein ABWY48_03670 [Pseudoxanthomonas sp.]
MKNDPARKDRNAVPAKGKKPAATPTAKTPKAKAPKNSPTKPPKRSPAPAAPIAEAAAQPKKDKLVRDSFTLPREDFELIDTLKDRALDFKRPTKKSELLRAGLQVLAGLDPASLRKALEALRPLKAGRPKNKS